MASSDEVESVETVLTDKYRARQADSFARVNSKSSDWKPCPILFVKPNGEIEFDIPQGYETVRPYTDSLSDSERVALHQQLRMMSDSGMAWSVCQLCGHPILNPFPIQNDLKKTLMYVGSSCVGNFMGAGYLTEQVRIYKENNLRAAFREWVPTACSECKKHLIIDASGRETRWMIEDYYQLHKKLSASDISKLLTARKITNVFKKAKVLGIPIPEGVLEEERPLNEHY